MRLPDNLATGLRHSDRWQMQAERYGDTADMVLWARLFCPRDLVMIGDTLCEAGVARPAEYCWGCSWRADGVPTGAVAYCLSAADMLAGASCSEAMTGREECEAVLGRMRRAQVPVLLVVDDGQNGLEAWVDAGGSEYAILISRGRCPGGKNSDTGRIHKVLWACDGLRQPWTEEEFAFAAADVPGSDWLHAHVEQLMAGERRAR
jgi:hypothetical protein